MSESQWLARRAVRPYEQIANEVRRVADAEARDSGLPGPQGGPADAYRHMIGAGELTRRLGPVAALAILESNEWRSEIAAENQQSRGVPVAPANLPAAISMDRHNNAVGIAGGARSWSFEDVVAHARAQIDRAGEDGAGFAGRPTWLPRDSWFDDRPDEQQGNWPSPSWSPRDTAETLREYPQGADMFRNRSQDFVQTPLGGMLVDPETGAILPF